MEQPSEARRCYRSSSCELPLSSYQHKYIVYFDNLYLACNIVKYDNQLHGLEPNDRAHARITGAVAFEEVTEEPFSALCESTMLLEHEIPSVTLPYTNTSLSLPAAKEPIAFNLDSHRI
jgi:hypothetical protein